MRGKDLLECMEHIDDALVEEALEPAVFPRKNTFNARWGMVAACVVVLGISASAFWFHRNVGEERIESARNDTASSGAMDNTAAAEDGGTAQGLPQTIQTGGGITDNAQTDMMADDVGAANSGSAADGTEAARQGNVEEADPDKDSAAAVIELQDELLAEAASEKEMKKLSYTVVSSYYGEKEDAVYDYPVPEKGKYFCYHYLQETMEYYAEQERTSQPVDSPIYAYDVVIDLYGDVGIEGGSGVVYAGLSEHISAGGDMIEQEYRRLSELGYAVRLSEDFQLTGTFTKVELDTFQALPEYGYTFRFADEY